MKATAAKKPGKRPPYLVMAAIIALVLSAPVAYLSSQPVYKASFSYQYRPSSLSTSSGIALTTNPLVAQVEVLRSQRFLADIQDTLASQGHRDWTPEKLAQAIQVTNPSQSDLIQVEIATPNAAVSQAIASRLDQAYQAYLKTLHTDMLEKQQDYIDARIKSTRNRLVEGQANIRELMGDEAGSSQAALLAQTPWGEKTLTESFTDLTRRLQALETEMAISQTQYQYYSALLNQDEKSLIEGVILGEDPVVSKLIDQMASTQTDANILSIKYTPENPNLSETKAQMQTLQHLLEDQRTRILSKTSGGKPIIRDSLRKSFISELMASKIKLAADSRAYKNLLAQRDRMLQALTQMAGSAGEYQAWLMEKTMLKDTLASLEKQKEDLAYQAKHLSLPVVPFQPLPTSATPVHHVQNAVTIFLAGFSGLFLMLAAVPVARQLRGNQVAHRAMLSILQELMESKGQQVIMMLPVFSSGHLNAAANLGGLLNQFGRDSLVIDNDLCHRLLSRKIPLEHPYGVFEHMLDPDMKKPYADPLSGAKILPLEATLHPEKIVEFSQVIQRLPRLWNRWPNSVIILDISQWHEAYHQLLPQVSQVVFYVPPGHQASVLLPKVFKNKYQVPVSLVEIQPEA